MNQPLIIASIILFLMAFSVGVLKQTWLLSGFNEQRVKDKDKLAKLVGSYSLLIGIIMLAGGFINYPNSEKVLFPIMLIGYLIIIVYVNSRMVE